MEYSNRTFVTEFILLAFSEFHQYQTLLFTIILFTYIVCLAGNMTIILLAIMNQSLHVPMYYFISIFSAEEMLLVSVVFPKLLAILMVDDQKISFVGCFVQVYSYLTFGQVESFCIMIMAYDRYLAINKPLHYIVIMSRSLCIGLTVLPWSFSLSSSLVVTLFTMFLNFCGPNEINHFFCDVGPLQSLACPDRYLYITNTVTTAAAAIASIVPFVITFGLYTKIIMTVSKIKTSSGKQKAFSTCSSHIIVAMLLYISAFVIYLRPYDRQREKYYALFYFLINPVFNPFIYALRNRDVKNVLKTILNFNAN